jgi:hypothetical protein
VSEVISDPSGAHFIYKVVAEGRLPLEEAREEIHRLISARRYRDSTSAFRGNVVFSDGYFNPAPAQPQPAQRRVPRTRRADARPPPGGEQGAPGP